MLREQAALPGGHGRPKAGLPRQSRFPLAPVAIRIGEVADRSLAEVLQKSLVRGHFLVRSFLAEPGQCRVSYGMAADGSQRMTGEAAQLLPRQPRLPRRLAHRHAITPEHIAQQRSALTRVCSHPSGHRS